MNVLSVCDGIGAAHVAWHGLGWRPYVLSEIEPFPRAVLAYHYGARDARFMGGGSDALPQCAPLLWGDFTALRERFLRRFGRSFASVDLLAGGTPCQAFSVAGNRQSLSDARGNLTLSYVRLADAIDAVRRRARRPACWIVWENVPGVLNTRDNAFGAFLGGLCGSGAALPEPKNGGWGDAGVVAGPARCAAWRVLDAQHFGLAQRRRRVVVVARGYFGGAGEWDGPDALLPLVESLHWHPAPRREAGQDVTGTLGSRTTGGGGLGTDFDLGGGYRAA
jgi:DNA (cytosine-5)-methyltransferase 1